MENSSEEMSREACSFGEQSSVMLDDSIKQLSQQDARDHQEVVPAQSEQVEDDDGSEFSSQSL